MIIYLLNKVDIEKENFTKLVRNIAIENSSKEKIY
jgi:hypothetical protein